MSTGNRKNQRKLLIIACSNRKVRTKGLLPAIQRYDGVTYRVIRKAQREGYFAKNIDIKILSAKFGLIDASTEIPYYDQRMDRNRAAELRPQIGSRLKRMIRRAKYKEIFINMGEIYHLAIEGLRSVVSADVRIKNAKGGIGSKAKSMKWWLLSDSKTR